MAQSWGTLKAPTVFTICLVTMTAESVFFLLLIYLPSNQLEKDAAHHLTQPPSLKDPVGRK